MIRRQGLQQFIRDVAAGDGSLQRDIVLHKPGGDQILNAHASPIPGPDEEWAGTLMVFNDFTELRRLEAVRTDFVANVSHEMSRKDIFLGLAKNVPSPGDEKLVPNPYKTWKDVNDALPAVKIEVLGPPPTSGTRDAFVELAMESFACLKAIRKKNKKEFKKIAHTIREDGAYVEAGENDNLIVQSSTPTPSASSDSASWIRIRTKSTAPLSTAWSPPSTASRMAPTRCLDRCFST